MSEYKLPKTYDFRKTEQNIYKWWEENGFFKPSNDPNKPTFDPNVKPFVISIPPPNITGELHLGHAMFVSMEDLMIRYHRMKGIPTLWVPGSDHAGIATQLQIEKALIKEGTSREEIGREEFERRAWAWKRKYGDIITQQIRRLGASCDWDRQRFTLDEGLSRAVREAFVHLYKKGLIYRGPRLINWSPGLKTAISDLEVEYSEEPGTLYYFKYKLSDAEDDFIPVATTRPETILGDTAVAVHPEDERYQKYIGREVIVPILRRKIPVIADEYVEREFGTGALKVTPGHDPHDFEIGERHNLQVISILDTSARINEHGGPYQGQDRFEARKNLWEDMRSAGLVIKEEDYTLNIPRSQRGGEIIEPMVSTQWFVKMDSMAALALEAVRDGRIKIIPEHFTKVYYNWLENIQDWCVSRQLWWGHRIPVWYCQECGEMNVSTQVPTSCSKCGSTNLEQDPDVLDTWFSSSLWPFSTLGWPDQTPDLEYFYPTSYMETGYDILFFWVARMIMSGLEYTGEIPFHTVYLHGLIRDGQGRKMSKTTGNVIDPLEVMNELGTDALRYTLLVGSTPGKDTNLSIKRVEANRNFANKIWNVTRFIISNLSEIKEKSQPTQSNWTLADSWIWARLQTLIRDVDRLFRNFQYGEAGRQIYEFFWSDFADWYIEIAKLQLKNDHAQAFSTGETLIRILDNSLRLLHPFTPFITEELWGHLKRAIAEGPFEHLIADWSEALIIAQYPQPRPIEDWEPKRVTQFKLVQEIVRSIRNLRAEKNVEPSKHIPAILVSTSDYETLESQIQTIIALSGLDSQNTIIRTHLDEKPEGHIALVVGAVEIFLPLSGLVNLTEERLRLQKDLEQTDAQISRLENLLAGPFASKAPEDVVSREREKLKSYQETAQKIHAQLETL